jgi:hypothetical protein
VCGGVSHFRFQVPDLSGARDLGWEAVIPCEEQADRPIELNRCVVVFAENHEPNTRSLDCAWFRFAKRCSARDDRVWGLLMADS